MDGSIVVKEKEDGGGGGVWFGRSIIRSCCKLDYGTAQKMIEGE